MQQGALVLYYLQLPPSVSSFYPTIVLARSRAAFTGAKRLFAILVSPLSLGCTPSLLSDCPLNPVYRSTSVMGEAVVFLLEAQVPIALFRLTLTCCVMYVDGMILATLSSHQLVPFVLTQLNLPPRLSSDYWLASGPIASKTR